MFHLIQMKCYKYLKMIILKSKYNSEDGIDNWDNNFQYLEYILNEINKIYKSYFPDFKTNQLTLKFDCSSSSSAPIYLRKLKTIILNADITYWCQVAYQYCHELCHYNIPEDVIDNFRWFEESICEMASAYFMNDLSSKWRNGIIYPEYHIYLKHYSDNILKNYKDFDLKEITYNSEIFKSLANNPYKRDYNRKISRILLKAFKKTPLLWSQVPKICYVKNVYSFNDFIIEWAKLSDDHLSNSILSILSLVDIA